MSDKPTRERLGSLLVELLEGAAFVFAEITDEKPWAAGDLLSARLTLEHGERVELSLCVASELAQTLAANLLALEPESEEAKASAGDAVGELANMIAGTLAVEMLGADVVCKIGVPQVVPETGVEHDGHLAHARCRVSLHTEDGHRVDASLAEVSTEVGSLP
jgi:hypothetical protein